MDAATRLLIEKLHQARFKYVLALTGGGTGAAAQLLNVPGGSRTILEVVVPYGEHALNDFLGKPPEQYCSSDTARDMARRAWARASWLAPGESVVGVACTASLATDRPKKGEHRFHLSTHSARRVHTYSLTLAKGVRVREGEEAVLDAVLFNLLAETLNVTERVVPPMLLGEALELDTRPVLSPLVPLLAGGIGAVAFSVDGKPRTDLPLPKVLVPGSFNPLHEGHIGLAEAAAQLTGSPAAFELSVVNPDKPSLGLEEIAVRQRQFTWRGELWLTRAPYFALKASLFPGSVFVVGYDTAVRILAPQYYRESVEAMHQALETIQERGCRFLVAGRVDSSGKFLNCRDLDRPTRFRDLFAGIPETLCRFDISSTQLRQPGGPR